MNFRLTSSLLFALLMAASLHAQTAPAQRVTIVLDPAHGGSDTGAHLERDALEKDVDISLAHLLRAALTSQGFNVVLTREADPADPANAPPTPTPDQRAEIANHAHPLACIILHASRAGHGVHLFTSALIPVTVSDEFKPILPWETAQAASIPQSLRLVNELASSFNSARIPLIIGRASVRPIDTLACAAVLLEVAPLAASDSSAARPASDSGYQQTVADAIANALISWRQHNQTSEPPSDQTKPGLTSSGASR